MKGEMFTDKRSRYPSPRIRKELAKRDITVSRNRVSRLMRDNGLRASVSERVGAQPHIELTFAGLRRKRASTCAATPPGPSNRTVHAGCQ